MCNGAESIADAEQTMIKHVITSFSGLNEKGGQSINQLGREN